MVIRSKVDDLMYSHWEITCLKRYSSQSHPCSLPLKFDANNINNNKLSIYIALIPAVRLTSAFQIINHNVLEIDVFSDFS